MSSPATVAETSPTKYPPGKNPKSLANLKPPFPKGVSGNPGNPVGGPLLTPAIRRYAHLTAKELMALSIDALPAIEAVAVVTLLKGIDPKWGDRTRELLANRLDGSDSKGDTINIEKAILIRYIEGG